MFSSSVHPLTLSQRDKTSVILLWLTPGNFTRQTENSHQERVNLNDNGILLKIHSASQNVNRKRRYLNINTHTETYICIYMYVCMCASVYLFIGKMNYLSRRGRKSTEIAWSLEANPRGCSWHSGSRMSLTTATTVRFHLHRVIWSKLPLSHVRRVLSNLTLPSIIGCLRVLRFPPLVILNPMRGGRYWTSREDSLGSW